jgi:hypothetical protein
MTRLVARAPMMCRPPHQDTLTSTRSAVVSRWSRKALVATPCCAACARARIAGQKTHEKGHPRAALPSSGSPAFPAHLGTYTAGVGTWSELFMRTPLMG